MKKSFDLRFISLIFVSLLFGVFFVNIVSAYYFPQIREISQGIVDTYVDVFEPVVRALLGGQDYSGLLLFEKLLIFVLLLSLIFVILSRISIFEEQAGIKWIIAIVIPLLAVRFLNFEWLETIILQYQVLGIALSSILPFLIYFYFLHGVATDLASIRKIGWILFIVIYFGLWSTADTEIYGQVYFWTGIVSLVFLFFDGTIHRYYIREEMMRSGNTEKWQQIAKLRRDIGDIQSDIGAGRIPDKIGRKIIKKKQNQIIWIQKNM